MPRGSLAGVDIGVRALAQDLANTGAIESAAIVRTAVLTASDLASIGAIESNSIGYRVILESEFDLASAGAIESGAVNFIKALFTNDLASTGAIESGEASFTRILYAFNLAAPNAIQSGDVDVTTPVPTDPEPPIYPNRVNFNGDTVNWDAKTGWQRITDTGWSSTGLPTGLLIADNGIVSGTTTTNGNYTVTITYTDGEAVPWSADPFNWEVKDAPPAPSGDRRSSMNLEFDFQL